VFSQLQSIYTKVWSWKLIIKWNSKAVWINFFSICLQYWRTQKKYGIC
jgi:hypothetical protein